ncbi:hypothetical protein Prudu_011980 [Prunus dulcis]|uniref:Uncharacterized protein n=1 Tax=Prunus dulcis TaxID=3755 RepID=A0A4Y1RCP5_PRUDU|nr:hypothetical protein Prudu_011980 [Prunus dulcis]
MDRSRRHLRATRSPARAPSPPPWSRRSSPTSRRPWHAWKRSETADFRRSSLELPVARSPPFLNQISRAPGVRLISRRDPREVQLARTSSLRRTKETTRAISLAPAPPPKCRISLISETVWQVEDFGYGQNIGETLPNFRQKSEGN